ncbi:hypothetical protein LXA43DRAFT_903878 [Ganoderma leucocontextum]|nr:hypothetical protein LXA43DRAFT_903887 [Ganoderma leucocontextum]KAI1783282.1 hypothetical protein LXA43DRAFT_903878 [Ganoderma leucocontextum]
MSTAPMILYQVYYDDRRPFNVHEASTTILENMVTSRFIGREPGLLVLNQCFRDLAARATVSKIKCNQNALQRLSEYAQNLILVVNTHASPHDGGLLYGDKKTTGLETIINHIVGKQSPVSLFRKTALFVLCCGGFAQHSLSELRDASKHFSAVFAFGAPVLDPILIMTQFVTSLVDYYVMGQEDLWLAIRYSLKQEVIKHTSIFVGHGGDVFNVCDASWRSRPNGEEVQCCQQPSKYHGTDSAGKIKFRCRAAGHIGPRTFRVEALPEIGGFRMFWGKRGGPRYMICKC